MITITAAFRGSKVDLELMSIMGVRFATQKSVYVTDTDSVLKVSWIIESTDYNSALTEVVIECLLMSEAERLNVELLSIA